MKVRIHGSFVTGEFFGYKDVDHKISYVIIDGTIHEVETSLLRDYESLQTIIERNIEKHTDKVLNWFYGSTSEQKLALIAVGFFASILLCCLIR
jgi:riboflavin synthase